MAVMVKTELELKHEFDPLRSRHYLNGALTVLHCHHFATLYSQLADDAEIVDGKKLLFESSEEVFHGVLANYFRKHGIETEADRVTIAEEYYAAMGLGLLKIVGLGKYSGYAELLHSHLDEGWIKKWGQREKPVNFITQGYIAAVFATVFDLPAGSYTVEEQESLVSGAPKSIFRVVKK